MISKTPTLHDGEIMCHAATRTIGQVVDTIYPPDNKLEKFEQVLRLKDGTHQQFRLVELLPATSVAIEQFWKEARFPHMIRAEVVA
jgi:hypothetical protein